MSSELLQGTEEWLIARLGRVTASRVAEVVARTKTGYGASRANYMAELIVERLTKQPTEKFVSGPMLWGTQTEPQARAAYEWLRDCDVAQVGFVPHPRIEMSGASPDGLVGEDGLLEVKCPSSATHIETLLGQKVPEKYVTQMQWQMACTGREWCDFVSYDPRMPEEMRLFVKRVPRDAERIAELEAEVSAFLAEVDETVAQLRRLYAMEEAA